MSFWRPIQKAPKDETLMLTYSARCGVKLNIARLGDDGIFLLIKCNESWAFALDTTHWMPLPKPPKFRAAKSKPAAKTTPKTRGWRKMSTAPLGTPIEVRFKTDGTSFSNRTVTVTLDDHGFWIGKTYWARFNALGQDRLDDWRPLSK